MPINQTHLPFISKYRKYYQSLEPFFIKKKNKSYATIIFFFLVLSLFGWYAVKPTIQTILYLRREIKDKTEVTKAMDTKINSLIQAQVAYENIQPLLPYIDEAIPQRPNVIPLAANIQSAAAASNASVSGMQANSIPILVKTASGSAKIQKKQTEFPVSMTLDGSYTSLKSFIQELVSFRRIIRITSLNFIPVDQRTGVSTISALMKPKLRLVVQLSSYYESP